MFKSIESKVFCAAVLLAIFLAAPEVLLAQRGGHGGGGFHGGGGGFHGGGSSFHGGGGGYSGGGHSYGGGHYAAGYGGGGYGSHGGYYGGGHGGYYGGGRGGYYGGGRGGYYGHGGYWGGGGWGYPGFGFGFGWGGFGISFNWGGGYGGYYPYGYGVGYYPPYYPYYYPYPNCYYYSCAPSGYAVVGSNYTYPSTYQSSDAVGLDYSAEQQTQPAPRTVPPNNAASVRYANYVPTPPGARLNPVVSTGNYGTTSSLARQLPPLRPEVQNVIRALRAMPPQARAQQINSGRYNNFSPQELMLVKEAAELPPG